MWDAEGVEGVVFRIGLATRIHREREIKDGREDQVLGPTDHRLQRFEARNAFG